MLWRWLKHGVQPNAEAARRREQLYEHEIPMRKHMAANSLDEELYECASDLLTESGCTRCACGMSHFQLNRPLLPQDQRSRCVCTTPGCRASQKECCFTQLNPRLQAHLPHEPIKRHVWSPSKDTFELMILKLFLLAGLLASASSQTAAEINAETIATLESGTKITKAPKASNAVSKASNKVDEREHPIQYTSTASGCQHSQHRHHHHHHHHTHHHHPPPLTLRP
jgi:hypothetical protein